MLPFVQYFQIRISLMREKLYNMQDLYQQERRRHTQEGTEE